MGLQSKLNNLSNDGKTEEINGKTDKDEESMDGERKEEDDLPIDRGWAWMVLVGCFMNAMMVVGYHRSLAMLFVEFLDIFDESTTTTTLVQGSKALSYSLFSLVSMHVVLEFLGTRKTVLLGSTIFVLSIIGAAFSPNITSLIIVHFFLGIGHSMIHSPGLVLIGHYFKKRRSLATTTASAAVSVSMGFFPLLTEYLLEQYGLRGTMLLLAGICLNCWVGASLYRPLESFKKNKKKRTHDKEELELMLKGQNNKGEKEVKKENMVLQKQTGNVDDAGSNGGALLSRSTEVVGLEFDSETDDDFRRRTFSEGARYFKKKPDDGKMVFASTPDILSVSIVDVPNCSNDSPENTTEHKSGNLCLRMLKAFDFSLFRNPMFLLITVLSHFAVVCRQIQVYLPARVNELGFSQSDAAILLLITGILDFFCRIFYGFLADLKFLKVHQIMAIGLFITGLTTQFISFFNTFPLLVVYSVIIGIFGSAYGCLLPTVIVEFMGLKLMAKTMGFTNLYHGLAVAITHPIIGSLRDLTGSYAPAYHYVGSATILASLLLMCEPLVRAYIKNTSRKNKGCQPTDSVHQQDDEKGVH